MMDTTVNFDGYLEKTASGIFKNTSRVWMVLDNLTLAYYKDKSKSVCIGSIDVHDIQIVRLTSEKKGMELQIRTKDKTFKFVAESAELAAAWVKVIHTSMSNKILNRQSSLHSPISQENSQITQRPSNFFGVTLKPTQSTRKFEHREELPGIPTSRQEQSEQHDLNDLKSKQEPKDTFSLKGGNQTGFQKSNYITPKYTASTEKDQTLSYEKSNTKNKADNLQNSCVEKTTINECISKSSNSGSLLITTNAGVTVISSTPQSMKLEAFENVQPKNSKNNKQPPTFSSPLPLSLNMKATIGLFSKDKTDTVDFAKSPKYGDSEKLKSEQTEIAMDISPIQPDLPTIQGHLSKVAVNDQTNTTNAIASSFSDREVILSDFRLDERENDLKVDGILNKILEKPNASSNSNSTDVQLNDEINVRKHAEQSTINNSNCKHAEQSTINNNNYTDVDISNVEMRKSKRISATEKRGCTEANLSNVGDNAITSVDFKKLSKSLRTVSSPNNSVSSSITVNNNKEEPHEINNWEKIDLCLDIATGTRARPSHTSNIDIIACRLDAPNSFHTPETDGCSTANNPSLLTDSFKSYHRLKQYFKTTYPEFDIEFHRVCSKNPVEILQSMLEYNHCALKTS